MIITEPKPVDQILQMVSDQKNILVIGCEEYVAITQTGGEKQAEVMTRLLEMGFKIREDRR